MANGNPPKGADAAPVPFIVAPTKLNGIGDSLKVFCKRGAFNDGTGYARGPFITS